MGLEEPAIAWSPSIRCWSCGTAFAIESALHKRRLADGNAFYCPNGHANYYSETELKRLKRELESTQAQVERERKNREWAEKRAKGANIAAGIAKAATKRLKARVHAGVCTDCNRTFKQLAAHMKAKHAK